MNIKTLAKTMCFILLVGCADSAKEFLAVNNEFKQQSLGFTQTSVQKKVDILFVVDNSTSMRRDQANIGAQFNSFISNISKSNYRIGFINTDSSSSGLEDTEGFHGNLKAVGENGELYIDGTMSNKATLFKAAITNQVESPCSAAGKECHEEPMKSVMLAISKKEDSNKSFFRKDASFATVILTDEDEGSNGVNAMNPLNFYKFLLQSFKLSKEAITSFVIAIKPGDTKCLKKQRKESISGRGANFGNLVWLLSKISGGFGVSICDPNFGFQLAKISKYLEARLLYKSILLDPPPAKKKKNKINVIVKDKEGNVLEIKWKLVADKVLMLEPTPPKGSQITVTYIRKKTKKELETVVTLTGKENK